jgi:SAM-dependent methyltransferase
MSYYCGAMIPPGLRWRLRRALIWTPAGRRFWWRSHGRHHELDFWESWFEQKGAAWGEDYARRVGPAPLIDDPLITEQLDELDHLDIRILDVGAGPITKVGVRYPGKRITVVPVDPLAAYYDRLLRRYDIQPAVRTIEAHGERLLRHFSRESFDIAFAVNSLDHSYDPLLIVANMLELVVPEGVVLLRHARNEGEHRSYSGLHQWNFDVDQGDLVVWNHAFERRLSEQLGPAASVEAWLEDGQVLVRVRPRARALASAAS